MVASRRMSHRPSLRVLRVSLAALALHLLGCQPAESPTDAKPAGAPAPAAEAPAAEAAPAPLEPAQPDSAVATVAGEGSVVSLIDAGAEPREPLRLRLTAGQEQAMVMTMRMGMAMQVGPNAMPKTALPPMQMTMALRVREITAEGDIRTEFSLDKIDVLPEGGTDPAVVEQLRGVLTTMNKMSGTSTVTPRGIVKSAEFNIPADINPQVKQTMESMKQQINQLSVPFPEEALGVGAKWTVTANLEQQGMKLQQVATWELKAREGDVIKLANSVVQTAAPQSIAAPGMPPGASVSLERLSSTGAGTTELDLTRVSPLQGHMSLTSSLAMNTEANGAKMPLTMDMDVEVDVSGK